MNSLLLSGTTASEVTNWLSGSGNIFIDMLVIVLVVVMVALLFTALVVHRAFRSVVRIAMPELEAAEKAKRAARQKTDWNAVWRKLLSLRPLEEEKDLEIDHEYDGIRELNNPVPAWFNALFYSTITFGVVYLFVYHVFGWGMLQDKEYVHEMAVAEKAKQAYLATQANLIDESSIEVDETGAMAAAGKAVFMANCAVCHGNAGEGGIGPNLADDYWLHGGEIKDVFRVVKYGVPDKGMVPWEQTLSPGQIAEVSNFIVTLRGTNPPNAKDPQGEKVVYGTGDEDGEAEAEEASEPGVAEEEVSASIL